MIPAFVFHGIACCVAITSSALQWAAITEKMNISIKI